MVIKRGEVADLCRIGPHQATRLLKKLAKEGKIILKGSVSQLRNKVLGRVFRELQLIEQWGSGLNRIIDICQQQHIKPPEFEELDHFFRITLYPRTVKITAVLHWHVPIIAHIHQSGKISAMEAEKLWKVTRRTATTRLKKMCQDGLFVELSTGSFDPYKTFILAEPGNQPRRT